MAGALNITLLVEVVAIVIAASAFLFYWNRLLGSVVAFLIRLYTWRVHKAYITIGSLQISPLAGRISFRDIEYHSSNISARVLHGNITWRYWLFRVRQEEDIASDKRQRNRLPCRIKVKVRGVETFLFNRTPAYDEIVERMKKHEAENADTAKSSGSFSSESRQWKADGQEGIRKRNKGDDTDEVFLARSSGDSHDFPSKPPVAVASPKSAAQPVRQGVNWFRESLPIDIVVETGSVVLGSDASPMVLIGDVKRANGTLHITDSRSPCDLYKLLVDMQFQDVKVLMRTNVDYSGPLLAHGKKVYDELLKKEPTIADEPPSVLSSPFGFHRLTSRFKFLKNPKFSSPPVAGLPRDRVWRGLARYRMADPAAAKSTWREEREYAKVTTLLDTPALDFVYYSDAPGPVPPREEASIIDEADEFGNVEPSPEYGIDIVVHGGLLKYGPWADRQRDALQTAFAPSIFFDSEPRTPLQVGDTRVHTHLVVNVQLIDETTLRIPTREPSKDWQYDGVGQAQERRYGWLDVTVGVDSSITYTQSQFATVNGYDAMLALHLDTLAIASSVNMETFINSKSCKLSITMPTPLRWDAQRDWGFDITMDEPIITLMRDHTTLISDLARDWSSGQQGDFHHFVPNHYNFRVTLLKYAFHLFINDFNIVDRPRSREDNAFMDVYGHRMDAYVAVGATQYRPEYSVVPFSIRARDIRVELCVPLWDTHRSFNADQVLEVGKIGELNVNGSYRYYAEPKPDHQETLLLHLQGRRVIFKALGWVLRRLFCVKDNYFGTFTQFTTMQEFLERFDHDPNSIGDPVEEKYRPGRSDPFSVQVTMDVDDSLVLLSEHIYGFTTGVVMPVPHLQMALRSQDQFMDLSLDSAPTYLVASADLPAVYASAMAPPIVFDAVYFEGIELKANRLFGPQPRAETYLCLWEVLVPKVSAFVKPSFVVTLQAVLQAVAYNYTDAENAPAAIYQPPALPDVTFLKLAVDDLVVLFETEDAAASVALPQGVNLDLSTWATRSCLSTLGLSIPDLDMALLHRQSGALRTVAELKSSITLDIYKAPFGWLQKASKQQAFIRKEDEPTKRIQYLYGTGRGPSKGRFNQQVFVPNPRSSELEEATDDETESDENGSLFRIDSPSSLVSDDTAQDIRPRRRRSRPNQRVNSPGGESSIGDESDTVSTVSSSRGSSESEDPESVPRGMADSLAIRLRHFRSLRLDGLTLNHSYRDTDRDFPETSPRRETDYGTVFRVVVSQLSVILEPDALGTGSNLLRKIRDSDRNPTSLLDSLQISHTDALPGPNDNSGPLILDIAIPLGSIKAYTESSKIRGPLIDGTFRGLSADVTVQKQGDESTVELNTTISTIAVTLWSQQASPVGVVVQNIPLGHFGAPLLRMTVEDVRVDLLHRGERMRLRTSAALIDTKIVTTAFAEIAHLARAWQVASRTLTLLSDGTTKPAILMYRLIEAAQTANVTSSQPGFVFESSYGLHVEDQRNVRRDLGWMIMARLRHWLLTLPVSLDQPNLSMSQMCDYVTSEMSKVEDWSSGTEAFIRQQPFLKSAFGKEVEQISAEDPGATGKDKLLHVFVTLGLFNLEHQGRTLESPDIVSSSIKLTTSSFGIQQSIGDRAESTASSTRVLVAVKSCDVEIQSSIFSALDPLLSLGDSDPASKADTSLANSIAVVVDMHLDSGSLTLIGGGLRVRAGLHQGEVSVVLRDGRSGTTAKTRSSRKTVLASVDLVEVVLSQPIEVHSILASAGDRVVIMASASSVRAVLDHRESSRDGSIPSLRLAHSIQHLHFDSRPQLKAFYAFGQDWKQRYYPQYKPIIEKYHGLITKPRSTGTQANPVSSDLQATVDLSIGSAEVQLRAAKGLWIRWEVGKVYLTRSGTNKQQNFGARLAPQLVGAYTTAKKTKTRDSSTIRLPSVSAIGKHWRHSDQHNLSATVNLGVFTGILKPAILDRLLSLHQRLGADMVEIIRQYRGGINGAVVTPKEGKPASAIPGPKTLLDLRISVAGVRFGLRADDVATMLLFEAISLQGYASNLTTHDASLQWRAKVDHFGLSLGHLDSDVLSEECTPTRKYRSASMVFDVDVQEIPGGPDAASQLNVYLNQIHTVMHVAALSELSDLVKSWAYDIHILRENRGTEVAELKEQTHKLIKRLEPDPEETVQPSWFASRLLTVEITGLGIAIPLSEGTTIDLQRHHETPGPALLFSIHRISFQNRRNETARFQVHQTALQFLDLFDQNVPKHFAGHAYASGNCMRLPLLDAEAQMAAKPGSWSLATHCSADDFKLTLSPSIADSVFRLIDMYRQGKAHISQLEKQYLAGAARGEGSDSVVAKYLQQTPVPTRRTQQILVRMSFTFNSGVVELSRLTSEADGDSPKKRSRPDVLVLPSISLWVDYTGPRNESPKDGEDGVIILNAAVHASRNIVRPTILPFFVELVNRIENHHKRSAFAQKVTEPVIKESTPETVPANISESTLQAIAQAPTGRVRLRATLRIDKSEFRLSCAPDSNAYVDVKWASGGFIANTTLGGEETTTLSGAISGVTANLSHEFADRGRSCLEAGAKDMSFSIAFCPNGYNQQKGLSITMDTSISAKFRLDAFSAWLIFTSVWLDNGPKFEIPVLVPVAEATAPSQTAEARPQMAIAALIRLRSVDFDTNVSVSRARLQITPIVLRTLSNGERTILELRVGTTKVTARGDISGDLVSESLVFHTSRRSRRAVGSDPSVLSMSIEGGDLSGNLFLADTNIVRFHLEPAKVTLADDWRSFVTDTEGQVDLAFAVNAGNFQGVLRLLAIPRVIGNFYTVFDLLDSQQKIAAQRSETFKENQARKMTNPSTVATAFMQTARKTTSTASPSAPAIKTAQTMRFDLSGIEIGIFNEGSEAGHVADFYRFAIGKIQADMRRQATKDGEWNRDLSLLVDTVIWQNSEGSLITSREKKEMSAKEVIDLGMRRRAVVASLPMATLTMNSLELKPPALVLEYDFDLHWGEVSGDVAFHPNFFEDAWKAFRELAKGLEEQEEERARRQDPSASGFMLRRRSSVTRSRRRTSITNSNRELMNPTSHGTAQENGSARTKIDHGKLLTYSRRHPERVQEIPIPKLKPLGEATSDAAKLLPRFREKLMELPPLSHRFFVMPLEEGMDILLKLYEKQLPDGTS